MAQYVEYAEVNRSVIESMSRYESDTIRGFNSSLQKYNIYKNLPKI